MTAINLSNYHLKVPVEIRFSDFDSLGHVNNAVFNTYLEQARIEYFSKAISAGRVNWREDGIILARLEVDFRKPITEYDNYYVYIRCSRLGTKSFDFSYVITKEENEQTEIIAEAKTVMVCFDYHKNKTIEIRSDWKQKAKAFEKVLL